MVPVKTALALLYSVMGNVSHSPHCTSVDDPAGPDKGREREQTSE